MHKKRPCSQRGNVREDDLFEMVEDLLGRYEISPTLYEWGMDALKVIASKEIKSRDDAQVVQYRAVQDIQSQLDVLLDMTTRGLITNDRHKEKSAPLEKELIDRQQEQKDSFERSKNWYEFVGNTLDDLTNVNQKFTKGKLIEKNRILKAIGENPILMDGKLSITPYNWLKPVGEGLIRQKIPSGAVRTGLQQIDKDVNLTKKQDWYPGLESNQRPKA